ncbi:MAG TPA: acyltransferase family protein [Burkholderiales bacterium]|nr:acyltransferase family protein [Burkholderiales bacterium]
MTETEKNIDATETPAQHRPVHPRYRADIDGLRAVAVLSVLGFHLFPDQVPGGFVGVDIFFVISGFLISTIIFGNLERGSFSYLDFYARRIRRIFPALVLVLVVSLAFSWIDLFPEEFKKMSANTFAGATFAGNIIEIFQSPYFEPIQVYNPMLHLWSLGIEEQFYILWPLLLGLVWTRRKGFLALTLLVALASFAANIWYTATDKDLWAFFSPHARFWELMLGGILAYYALKTPQHAPIAPQLQSVAGFALIAVAVIALTAETPFPGWAALLPTIGAFLMISAGPEGVINKWLLDNRLMVGIGLISYPLYLWHWPLLSFAKYAASGSSLSVTQRAVIGLSALVLATATYHLVEKKCRRAGGAAALGLLGCMVLIAAFSLACYLTAGVPHRFKNAEIYDSASKPSAAAAVTRRGNCFLQPADQRLATFCQSDSRQPPNLLVWGDSQAESLYQGLVALSTGGQGWALAGRPGCAPVITTPVRPDCDSVNEAIARSIAAAPDLKLVVLVLAIRTMGRVHEHNAEAGLHAAVEKIVAAGKKAVILIGNPAIIQADRYFNSFCFDRPVEIGPDAKAFCSISRADYDKSAGHFREVARAIQERFPQVTIVEPSDALCDRTECKVLREGKALYSYTDHLSDFGSRLVGELIYRKNPDLLR